jgi:hypothetical protein
MKKVTAYLSENNILFHTAKECAENDGYIVCPVCKSSGKEKYEHRIPYPSNLPDSGWVDDTIEIRERDCSRCNGIGYVKYTLDQDPDYQEYNKLKDLFTDENMDKMKKLAQKFEGKAWSI